MKKVHLLLLAVLVALVTCGQSTEVVLSGSQTKKIISSIIKGQEYVLQISTPAGYDKTDRKYPVVYLMDSQWDFPLLSALYGELYFDGFIPELIIVGITWGGDHPNPDSLRARDYTPTKELRIKQSGGADQFLSVIENEVFPLVESQYRVNANDRTLAGCSLGGLFALYTLFTHSDMFNRYIAASPAFNWDKNVLNQYEEQYQDNSSRPPAKLFMCVGGVELSAAGFENFATALKNRRYQNLEIESRTLENTGHSGTKGEGYARGLQFVFGRPSLALSAKILKQYEGNYKLDDGTKIQIKMRNDSLVASVGNSIYPLYCASETDFYATCSFLKINFLKNDKNIVTGFLLSRYGSNMMAAKDE
jgi:predicted alpha/beta superfamily hydrolase